MGMEVMIITILLKLIMVGMDVFNHQSYHPIR